MRTKCYLIVSKSGSVRAVKSPRVDIGFDEVAIAVDIHLPDSVFKPRLEATITATEDEVSPLRFDAERITSIQKALSHEVGFSVKLTQVTEGDKKEHDNV